MNSTMETTDKNGSYTENGKHTVDSSEKKLIVELIELDDVDCYSDLKVACNCSNG